MSTPIVIKFTLSPAEYARGVRSVLLRLRISWLLIPAGLAWIGSPFISYAAQVLNGQKAVFQPDGLFYTVSGIAFFAFLFGMAPWLAVRKMNPAIRDAAQEFRFSESGVEWRSAVAESKFDWRRWVRFQETSEYFLLCPDRQSTQLIPKRAFASEDERKEFRELLKRKLPSP